MEYAFFVGFPEQFVIESHSIRKNDRLSHVDWFELLSFCGPF